MARDRLPTIVVLALVVVALGAAAATLDSGQLPTDTSSNASGPALTPDPSGGPRDAPERTPVPPADSFSVTWWTPPLPAVLGGLTLALVGALVFLFVRTGTGDPIDVDEPTDPADEPDLQAVGEAAGNAADRIESRADVDNEVYRAWREMVRHLPVSDPETTTPEEFEATAVAAGMRPDDVAELTRLFAEVRYGERDPDGREERALDALRRIEAAHAGEAGDASGGANG
ncbi:hypothetical protein Huta_1175 [Halorhabdus utahensis DSM 12940]|uniref:Protein-glutamine gamma-glutamyltransferase-like C-terminal domain-containing protein n=1 Tax=Halorhabdus utahensis (strain DSM 12940 / JCM 11049 / AX-2) TaxID=519442 RepID=C7NMN8_HALUD|nr:DUF4129 domain-containing protein [Halorhabdus utahensis]ACV11351.1 hypothetical protein Huta_1175 [Halorhabdus utahensis DSM 12940]